MLSRRAGFIAAMLFACAGEASTWRIEVTTRGGIHGRGTGTFVIDSTGAYTVTDIHGKRCSFRPADARMRRLAAAVAKAKPEQWKPSYLPDDTCCDRIEWTLAIERGKARTSTTWIDVPKPMPKDLAAILEALRLLRVDHVCR